MSNAKIANVLIVCLAVVSVVGIIFFTTTNMASHNSMKEEHLKEARIEACRTIEDETLRAFCINGYIP